MIDQISPPQQTNWLDALTSIVERNWEMQKRAVLLSTVPGLLRAQNIQFKALTKGESLRHFIEHNAQGRLSVVRDPNDELVWGLVPSAADAAIVQSAFQREGAKHIKRAHTAIWRAFYFPCEKGRNRYVTDNSPFRYVDIDPTTQPPPANMRQIGTDLLIEPAIQGDERKQKALSNIQSWLQKEGLSEELFFLPRTSSWNAKTPGHSALENLLRLFTDEELARIAVPLDVVARLSRSR